jgi:hypothetical protein
MAPAPLAQLFFQDHDHPAAVGSAMELVAFSAVLLPLVVLHCPSCLARAGGAGPRRRSRAPISSGNNSVFLHWRTIACALHLNTYASALSRHSSGEGENGGI